MIIGRSIGSGPAIYLCSRREVQACIVVSGFTSLKQVVRDHVGSLMAATLKQRFNNLSLVPLLSCHLLIVHGRKDTIVLPYHA